MKVAISGKSGLIGTALAELLESHGATVLGITRSTSPKGDEREVGWDYASAFIEQDKLEDLDAIIHLAGENIATGPWTETKKRRIYESRVLGTRFLCETIQQLHSPPRTFVCASAIGYYGNRGSETLSENSDGGSGFLAKVSKDWEASARVLEETSTRLVVPRIGLVLSPQGGLLTKLRFAFSLGLGSRLGSGGQYLSWIMLEDLCEAVRFLLLSEIRGPVNMVSPEPVTNADFTQTLGKVLHRPTFLTVPSFALQMLPGGMGRELLLASQRAIPEILTENGFTFRYDSLEEALEVCLA